MRLAVFSHKVCWPDSTSPSGYVTTGGFPRQMEAIASLFDQTTLLVPCASGRPADGSQPLVGRGLRVSPLPPTRGTGVARKLLFPWHVLRSWGPMRRTLREVDVIHAAIPGDVGTLGMLAARWWDKRLFVRYCANWFEQHTRAQRWWRATMERRAGPRTPMFATGDSATPPSSDNPHIHWVFATSLGAAELAALGQQATTRLPRPQTPRLLTVGRLGPGKGVDATIKALAALRARGLEARLDIVGDGSERASLQALARDLGVTDHARFHGQLTRTGVLEVMADADVYLLLSRSEGFPKVVVEAMSTGLPVISTGVSVLPQLVGAGGGALVDSTQADHVADVITACLQDTGRYRRMVEAALSTAAAYTLERWAETIGDVLEDAWGPLRRPDA